jgi:hypothetical protein
VKKKPSKFKNQVAADSQEAKTRGSKYGYLSLPKGVQVLKIEAGKQYKLDFIPYTVTDKKHPNRRDDLERAIPGSLWYKRPFKVHNNVGVDNEKIVCPTSVGKPCPICKHRAKRVRESAPDEELAVLRASLRNLYVVVPLDNAEFEEKMHIWDISQFCFQDALDEEVGQDADYGAFPDPEEGMTVAVRFKEKKIGKKGKFAFASRIDFEDRDEAYDEDFIAKAPNLDEVLQVLDAAEIEKKFFELDDDEAVPTDDDVEDDDQPRRHKPARDEEEEEEETPRRAKPKKEEEEEAEDEEEEVRPHKKAKRVEPEEEEEEEEKSKPRRPVKKDEDEEEAEEDEDEKPAKRPAKKPPVEEDDEEEEEDEKPAKRPVKKSKADEEEEEEEDDPPAKKSKAVTKGKCPFGHKFGVDCEDFDECSTCKLWDDCYKAHEAV